MYKIVISPHFSKELKRFINNNPEIKSKVIKSLTELISDPDHPSLRNHKLNSTQEWSISVDLNTRIIFKISESNIYLESIGNHDNVYI